MNSIQRFFPLFCLSWSCFFMSLSVSSASDLSDYADNFLIEFQKDSSKMMNELPPKFDKHGNLIRRKPTSIWSQDIPKVLEKKNSIRSFVQGSQVRPFSAIDIHNELKNFFERGFQIDRSISNISPDWNESVLENHPWSSYYWASYKGGIADRYNDPTWPRSLDFIDYYQAFQKSRKINFDDQDEIDNLSPAEKYDILLGDTRFTMSWWSMEDAKQMYFANGKKIPTWFGICHGWAPASFKLPRPEKMVEYQIDGFMGKSFKLRFFPDDVKALASLLWANSANETYYLGTRCEEKDPKFDEIGRISSSDCWDVNPATWHLALIHQMNKNKSSFVIDATYDAEVWNQPVVSYSFGYFNPESKKNATNLQEAMVNIADYSSDKFKRYRSTKAVAVVGIKMRLTYLAESVAEHKEKDSLESDITNTVMYIYDLEIDSAGQIIGGEWYQNAHPDFLWVPSAQSRAMSAADQYLSGSWVGKNSTPRNWTQISQMASSYGQPLGNVVEGLIHRSRESN